MRRIWDACRLEFYWVIDHTVVDWFFLSVVLRSSFLSFVCVLAFAVCEWLCLLACLWCDGRGPRQSSIVHLSKSEWVESSRWQFFLLTILPSPSPSRVSLPFFLSFSSFLFLLYHFLLVRRASFICVCVCEGVYVLCVCACRVLCCQTIACFIIVIFWCPLSSFPLLLSIVLSLVWEV